MVCLLLLLRDDFWLRQNQPLQEGSGDGQWLAEEAGGPRHTHGVRRGGHSTRGLMLRAWMLSRRPTTSPKRGACPVYAGETGVFCTRHIYTYFLFFINEIDFRKYI